MHRVLALLLIPGLIATFGVTSSLHTHAYDGHDHPEHHHGLSAHEHDAVASEPDVGVAHLEGCDPGNHTVSYAFVCAAPPQVHAADAKLTLPATSSPEIRIERSVPRTDVRVHGPPSRSQAAPRAPPLIAHA